MANVNNNVTIAVVNKTGIAINIDAPNPEPVHGNWIIQPMDIPPVTARLSFSVLTRSLRVSISLQTVRILVGRTRSVVPAALGSAGQFSYILQNNNQTMVTIIYACNTQPQKVVNILGVEDVYRVTYTLTAPEQNAAHPLIRK